MDRSGLQRLVPIILVLLIIIVAVAALVSWGRSIFFGDQPPEPVSTVTTGEDVLTSTKSGSSVQMRVRGPIVAAEDFNSYTITATPSKRTITTYVGYNGNIVGSKNYDNSTRAYEQFVYALMRGGYMDGTPLEGDKNDRRGLCAFGRLYEFEVSQDNKPVELLWTTSCKSAKGSLDADFKYVRQLFELQIPDFDHLTDNLNFNG